MTNRQIPNDKHGKNDDPKRKYLGLTAEVWGVVGAIATVAAVLVALVPHFSSGTKPPSPQASRSVTTKPNTNQPSSFSSAPVDDFARQWGPGTLLITGSNTDLDSVPPNVNSDGASEDIDIGVDGELDDSNELYIWTTSGEPTAAECANFLSAQGVAALKPTNGEVICAGTDQGNIAVLKVKRVDLNNDDFVTDILVQVTVWSNSPSGSSLGQWLDKQWGPGTLLITGSNTDLDSVPPNVNSDGASEDIDIGVDGELDDSNELYIWTTSGQPTAAECANFLSTQGVAALKPTNGEVICAGTGQGNIAVLNVKRVDLNNDDFVTDILVQATVWTNSP